MAVPTWVSGQILTASDVNTWFVPLAAVKTADTSRSSNTTLTNDPDILFSLASNATYQAEAFLWFHGGASGSSDLQFQWTGPAGFNFFYLLFHAEGGATGLTNSVNRYVATSNAFCNTNGGSTENVAQILGTITTGGTAGTLNLQWAQNTSNATATVMRAGTHMTLRRIA